MERVQDRCLTAGVGWSTPGYLVREEFQREKLSGRAGIRAWWYERKVREGKGAAGQMVLGRAEGKSKQGKVAGEWERKRREYYRAKEWEIDEVVEMREKGELRGEGIIGREKRVQERERWKRIKESKFNRWYS